MTPPAIPQYVDTAVPLKLHLYGRLIEEAIGTCDFTYVSSLTPDVVDPNQSGELSSG